ncbi:hypothetical protein [Actinophytocola sp.]|uniref:hypothetical protein n=1 Tax=Actinophytocola sp. TaxID=1872138 RepID=UPI003899CACF
MKVLSRFVSPAGFALVLLLFFLLPFVSVSCDVPQYGDVGANYTGSDLVTGTEPDVSTELRQLQTELQGLSDGDAPKELSHLPDADVQVLAIVLAALALAGVFTGLVPRLRTRLLGAAAVAGAALIVTVVTELVAQSHLRSAVLQAIPESGMATQEVQQLEAAVDDMLHTEVGFWLVVVLLAIVAVATGTLGLFGDRLRAARSRQTSGVRELGGLPFGSDDTDGQGQPPPDA